MSLQENKDGFIAIFENISNKETLRKCILFSSIFVLIFECLKDFIIDRPLELYCIYSCRIKEGKIVYEENDDYKQNVKTLDKNPFSASIKWFQSRGDLTEKDVEIISKAKNRRNVFVHEPLNILVQGVSQDDVMLLSNMADIYKKLDSMWIYNVEDAAGNCSDPESIKPKDCYSLPSALLQIVKNIAIDNEEECSRWMDQIKSVLEKIIIGK